MLETVAAERLQGKSLEVKMAQNLWKETGRRGDQGGEEKMGAMGLGERGQGV